MNITSKLMILGIALFSLSGCNTLKGMQKDLASVAGAVEDGINGEEDSKEAKSSSDASNKNSEPKEQKVYADRAFL